MSEKKRNRPPSAKPGQKADPSPPAASFREKWARQQPVLRFLLGFVGCMAVFYLAYFSGFYQRNIEPGLLHAQASVGNALLRLFGHDTQVVGAAIASRDFSVDIRNGCDGLEAMAVLAAGIIIFPASRRQKGVGLLWGLATLATLNVLRIAGLYLAGLYLSSTAFELLHVQGGFILFTMVSVVLLLTWMGWVSRQPG